MFRLDNIRAWKFFADGERNSTLYKIIESGLDWSLLQFIMNNYDQWFVVEGKKQQLVRNFIYSRLFKNEKATRLLLDNLQGKTKKVHRFILNTRYWPETREFLLRNLSDHRVRRFLLEIWDEENVCLIVLNNLVPNSDYTEYYVHEDENLSSAARNFLLENLGHKAIQQFVIDHLDVEAVLRDLLLDNLHHKAVEKFVAEPMEELLSSSSSMGSSLISGKDSIRFESAGRGPSGISC